MEKHSKEQGVGPTCCGKKVSEMIYGIGCDLCSIARIEKALTAAHGEAFVRRVFGPAERDALKLGEQATEGRRVHHFASAAANFAAKEAFLKAAGTGLREPFSLCEIEAIRLENGAPVYRFSGQTAAWLAGHGLHAHLSLSHEDDMALAFCTLESEK